MRVVEVVWSRGEERAPYQGQLPLLTYVYAIHPLIAITALRIFPLPRPLPACLPFRGA